VDLRSDVDAQLRAKLGLKGALAHAAENFTRVDIRSLLPGYVLRTNINKPFPPYS